MKFLDYKSDFTKFGNDTYVYIVIFISIIAGFDHLHIYFMILNTATCSVDMKTMRTSGN